MNNKGTTLLIVILSILVIVSGGMLIYKIINEKEESEKADCHGLLSRTIQGPA